MELSQLYNDLEKNQINKDKIKIWSGVIKIEKFVSTISKLNLINFQYFICETITAIKFETINNLSIMLINDDVSLIRRLRIFGISGDLELKHRRNYFKWRYIGEKSLKELGIQNAKNFWDDFPNAKFFAETQSAFLWGLYDQTRNCWFDDKVGKAKLYYPVRAPSPRMKLKYITYSVNGQASFVRLLELEGSDTK